MSKRKLNYRLFEGTGAEQEIEQYLSDAGLEFDHIGWDDYDNSLEIYSVPPTARPSEAILNFIFDGGFSICYVNHTDNWETHYSSHKRPKGWRVSYPHKRNDGDPNVWLEEDPPSSWTKLGFKVVVA